MKNIRIFLIGALGYGLLEILWRGYTHPSMLLTGGICFLLINIISNYFYELSLFKKSLLSAFVITAAEITVGVIVNIKMNLNVWDYSALPFNIIGQVSLLYSFLWFVLSAVLIKILDFIKLHKKSV